MINLKTNQIPCVLTPGFNFFAVNPTEEKEIIEDEEIIDKDLNEYVFNGRFTISEINKLENWSTIQGKIKTISSVGLFVNFDKVEALIKNNEIKSKTGVNARDLFYEKNPKISIVLSENNTKKIKIEF